LYIICLFLATINTTFGVHGYDTKYPSMRPYFISFGPDIQNGKRVPPFRTVDLFSVWAELLGFPEAAAATNGSAGPARDILKPRKPVRDILKSRKPVPIASKL